MLEYKRRQEEELTKRMLEERNREKAEEKAARERIKQQIAMVEFFGLINMDKVSSWFEFIKSLQGP